MDQKQNSCATDKARIYMGEFASEQVTPKELSDELSGINTSRTNYPVCDTRIIPVSEVNPESSPNRPKNHLLPKEHIFQECEYANSNDKTPVR
jgi:hypothetical protein